MLRGSLFRFQPPALPSLRTTFSSLTVIADLIRNPVLKAPAPPHRHSRAGGNPVLPVFRVPKHRQFRPRHFLPSVIADLIRNPVLKPPALPHRHSRAGGNPVLPAFKINESPADIEQHARLKSWIADQVRNDEDVGVEFV